MRRVTPRVWKYAAIWTAVVVLVTPPLSLATVVNIRMSCHADERPGGREGIRPDVHQYEQTTVRAEAKETGRSQDSKCHKVPVD